VLTAWDQGAALGAVAREKPDIVVLNTMMSTLQGLDVCALIRKATASPIIILSADCTAETKLLGFAAGADDYVTKPFGIDEFMARVKAQLRRYRWDQGESRILQIANIRLDQSSYESGSTRTKPNWRIENLGCCSFSCGIAAAS